MPKTILKMEQTIEQISYKELLALDHLPQHIAIIMDGNGRWAKTQGKHRIFGHKNGVKAVREASEGCAEIGVKHLTLYAFSTENWNRPQMEVSALMELLIMTIGKEVKTLQKNNIKLNAIGHISLLPDSCQKALKKAINETSNNTGLTLTLALSYSSRVEITDMVRTIAQKVKNGQLEPSEITPDIIGNHLYTHNIPDPELLIRTSGEMRISNFLLWQIAYAELCFIEKYWPDFTKNDFFKAIYDFQNTERRFGMTSEQITN